MQLSAGFEAGIIIYHKLAPKQREFTYLSLHNIEYYFSVSPPHPSERLFCLEETVLGQDLLLHSSLALLNVQGHLQEDLNG